MTINEFKRQFKHVNFIYLDKDIILFRKPLEIYDSFTGETVKWFKGNDTEPVLNYIVNGKTIRSIIESWVEFPAIKADMPKGSRTGDAYSESWKPERKGRGEGKDIGDLPARMNVKIAAGKRDYNDMLNAFIEKHAASDTEHGITIDTMGFTTRYIHGQAGSVGIWGTKGEMVIHNHPKNGWPTFSKDDILSVAQSEERGIVAVSSKRGRNPKTAKYAGTYTFEKENNFNANKFMKALSRARISGKDYNDAVSKWLTSNQNKYGFKYTYSPARD